MLNHYLIRENYIVTDILYIFSSSTIMYKSNLLLVKVATKQSWNSSGWIIRFIQKKVSITSIIFISHNMERQSCLKNKNGNKALFNEIISKKTFANKKLLKFSNSIKMTVLTKWLNDTKFWLNDTKFSMEQNFKQF